MTIYVLVHGAWHDGSAWTKVVGALERQGHHAFAPTLPGHGNAASRQTSFAECATSIVDLVVGERLTDVVLVGHSGSASVIRMVAEVVPDRIRRLVFVSGVIIESGECLMDAAPPEHRPIFDRMAADSPDNTVMPPFDVWCATFINGASPELAHAAYQHISPQGYDIVLERVELVDLATLHMPVRYVLPTEDIVYPPGEWGWHPRLTSRLGPHRFLQMPGSHEVMFTDPEGLAEVIIQAGRD